MWVYVCDQTISFRVHTHVIWTFLYAHLTQNKNLLSPMNVYIFSVIFS